MKRIYLILSLILCSIASMAQVKFFEGTLDEALAKGKAENKRVLFLATSPNG